MNTSSTLAYLAIIFGTIGLILFIYYKMSGKSKPDPLNYISKGLIGVGVYLLAFSVLSIKVQEPYTQPQPKIYNKH